MKVVLTHLWPESNAGDYAIVRGTIDAIEDVNSEPVSFVGLSTFASHSGALAAHFPETLKKGVVIRPALIPGYKNDDCAQFNVLEKAALSLRYVVIALLLYVGAAKLARWLVSSEQRRTLTEIETADLVVIKGGAFLMGFRGVAGTLYLLRNALTAMWCAKLNSRCVIAPHSFGPFANRLQLWLLKVMLKDIHIYARERISLELLTKLGLKAAYLPDMAFYFGPQSPRTRSEKQVAVTVRPCPTFLPPEQQRSYYEQFAAAVAALIEDGFRIVFVPQVSGPDDREDDRRAIDVIVRLVSERTSNPRAVEVAQAARLEEKFRVYGESICCVGTRMHSVIFSCLTGTKVVALAYLGPKHQGIMEELELGGFVLDIANLSAERLLTTIRSAFARQQPDETTAHVQRLKTQIRDEFARLVRRN